MPPEAELITYLKANGWRPQKVTILGIVEQWWLSPKTNRVHRLKAAVQCQRRIEASRKKKKKRSS